MLRFSQDYTIGHVIAVIINSNDNNTESIIVVEAEIGSDFRHSWLR